MPFFHSRKRDGSVIAQANRWSRSRRGPARMGMPLNRQGGRVRVPPGGRARENRKFIQAPSPETWRKTISGGEGGCWRDKWGGLFLGYLLGKNYRRRDRDHPVPPTRMDAAVYRAEVCYPFGPKHGKASGSETARVHHPSRRRGSRMAARGTRAAAGDARGR